MVVKYIYYPSLLLTKKFIQEPKKKKKVGKKTEIKFTNHHLKLYVY